MKIDKLLMPILILCAFACETSKLEKELLDCIGVAEDITQNNTECEDLLPTNGFCETMDYGDHELSKSSKLFMKNYCLEVGDNIEFEDESGELIIFEITLKDFKKSKSVYNSFQGCSNNQSGFLAYCLSSEKLKLQMESSTDLTFKLELESKPDYFEHLSGNVGDIFEIWRKTDGSSWRRGLEIVTDQKKLSYTEVDNLEIYNKIELNNINYRNVYSKDISNSNNSEFKFYYNQELGLIGFKDLENVLWTIKD